MKGMFLLWKLVCFTCILALVRPVPEKIPIGAIFTPGTEDQQTAFRLAIHLHNANDTQARFKVEPVIEVLDGNDAFKVARARLLKLQHIFQLTSDDYSLDVRVVKRITNATDANEFLRKIETSDPINRKYVVLDCNADTGKNIIINHVQDIYMGRRNYHFLLTSLTDIRGLTGNISFNERGHRKNFSIDVIEMTINTDMTKIATWSDVTGMELFPPKYKRMQVSTGLENKTYVVTSILVSIYFSLSIKTLK